MAEQRRDEARPSIGSENVFRIGDGDPEGRRPAWLGPSVAAFQANVGDPEYPCHFGRRALELSELFATWVDRDAPPARLAADLAAFLDGTRPTPRRRMVMAVFFEPEPEPRDHEWYADHFWSTLAGLHDHDDRPWPDDVPATPADPRWEFSFHGVPMFVFAAAPTHSARRSRQLGPGMVMLFQPRNVFHGILGGSPAGARARERIRDRLSRWDSAPPHPVLGDYGDPANSEWKQYFIADDHRSLYGACPMSTHAEALLHELVAEQARRTPDALAVVAGAAAVEYRTLDRSANLLAAQLVAKGVRPDDRVAVMADRSVETVVSLLAILKAGAAYVPVDPAYPEGRRAYLMDDAGVDIVLTPRRLVATVPVGPRWLLLSDEPHAGDEDGSPPRTTVRPDNLAYVIYTSGSTGTPKGVAVSHRQVVNAVLAHHAIARPWPEAFLMPISFSFDASAVGVYWTLTAGGCLVLPTDDEHRDPARLRELIRRYGVTHTDSTPTLYELLLDGEPAALKSLRCVQVGGEACPPELVARHRRLLPDCVIENNYGPTEATIWSTTNVITPDAPVPCATVPIGTPIPGARAYLVGPGLGRVGAAEAGELCVGGAGVARGYHGRPALTAERFVPDPFTSRPGQRMYRTGDIARDGGAGGYEFLGRRDTQVKVRGHRIELGEIEAALRTHPDVGEAAVDVRTLAGEPTLVGYVRPVIGREVSDVALVSHLAPLLPDHMVPRRYVVLDGLPHTVSGKIDRRRLPQPVNAGAGHQSGPGEPVRAGRR